MARLILLVAAITGVWALADEIDVVFKDYLDAATRTDQVKVRNNADTLASIEQRRQSIEKMAAKYQVEMNKRNAAVMQTAQRLAVARRANQEGPTRIPLIPDLASPVARPPDAQALRLLLT